MSSIFKRIRAQRILAKGDKCHSLAGKENARYLANKLFEQARHEDALDAIERNRHRYDYITQPHKDEHKGRGNGPGSGS